MTMHRLNFKGVEEAIACFGSYSEDDEAPVTLQIPDCTWTERIDLKDVAF